MQNSVDELFAQIYDATKTRTMGYLLSRAGSPEDAHDLFQEVYVHLLDTLRRKGCDYISDPPAFVCNLAKTRLGKRRRRRRAVQVPLQFDSDKDGEELERWLASESDLADEVAQRDLVERAHAFVQGEDAVTRQVFYLHFGEEMTLRDVASELDIPESTVKSRLYRLLDKLRKHFDL